MLKIQLECMILQYSVHVPLGGGAPRPSASDTQRLSRRLSAMMEVVAHPH